MTLSFDIFFFYKRKNIFHFWNKIINSRASYCTWAFLVTRFFYRYPYNVTLAIIGIGNYQEHLCFTNTSCYILRPFNFFFKKGENVFFLSLYQCYDLIMMFSCSQNGIFYWNFFSGERICGPWAFCLLFIDRTSAFIMHF